VSPGAVIPDVTLYGREGCCLCDDALQLLLEIRERRPFELRERNIDEDDRLHREFLERIPVIEIDGRIAFELVIDARALEHALSNRQQPNPR
jgi:Glutaredoxin-like domain (DUF836)